MSIVDVVHRQSLRLVLRLVLVHLDPFALSPRAVQNLFDGGLGVRIDVESLVGVVPGRLGSHLDRRLLGSLSVFLR